MNGREVFARPRCHDNEDDEPDIFVTREGANSEERPHLINVTRRCRDEDEEKYLRIVNRLLKRRSDTRQKEATVMYHHLLEERDKNDPDNLGEPWLPIVVHRLHAAVRCRPAHHQRSRNLCVVLE